MNNHIFNVLIIVLGCNLAIAQNFSSSGLSGESLNNPTSLQFGPDDRLYVSQQDGTINVYTIARNGANDYDVNNTEVINLIKNIPNHNDDGTLHTAQIKRQVTGLLVKGTASKPVMYVTSSDYRIGGGGSGADKNLDTNSGMISKLTKNGNNWTKVDLVRGLPRSEENHATNGIQIDEATNTMYVAQGGHTNAGSPSNNFAFQTEYALSAAILTVDLDAIESMSTKTDSNSGQAYKYNLPTVDDPTRSNNNGQDVNDPFGGNDGLNQAKIVPGGPVKVYAPGFRNVYDVVLTENGKLYTWDNGANGGWGGHPHKEGGGNATNKWVSGEPGSTGAGPNDAQVNNLDGLHYVTGAGYYGGHPNPIRANPNGAGLFTNEKAGGENGVWRTNQTNNKGTTLPNDWPPLPQSEANSKEGDFQNAGVDDKSLFTLKSSTNGMDEYTASNFNGILKGNLLAASFNENIYIVDLNNAGSINNNSDVSVFASNFGSNPLDVIAQGDNDVFPGTVWAATYGANNITIFEPADYNNNNNPPTTCQGNYSNSIDEDNDGFTNADEIDNNSDPCNGAIQPPDFDGTKINGFLVSNLNDPDDDDDGIADNKDKFAWDAKNGQSTNLPIDYPFLNGDPGFGFFGLGFTGLMTNNSDDYLDLKKDENNSNTEIIAGGAVGLFTINGVSDGDAVKAVNSQENAYQFGIDVDSSTNPFLIESAIFGPVFNSTPDGNQAVGIYIGNGDQNNYLKLTVYAGGGNPVIEVGQENNGTLSSNLYPVSNIGNVSELSLFFKVDPSNGNVQTQYSTGGGNAIDVGPSVSLAGPSLTALQSASQSLAVGLISTTYKSNPDFSATWDYIKINTDNDNPNPIGEGEGLTGTYYNNINFTNNVLTRVDPEIDFSWAAGSPDASIGSNTFSVIWEGLVEAPTSGTYTFFTSTDDGVRLYVDNDNIIDQWKDQGTTEVAGTFQMTAGKKLPIRMEYYENGGGAVAKLSWQGPGVSKQIIPGSQLFTTDGGILSGPNTQTIDGTEIIEFTNTGNQSLTITDVALNGGSGFQYNIYTTLPTVLQANQTFDLEVSYTGNGNQTGRLSISQTGNTTNVTLFGVESITPSDEFWLEAECANVGNAFTTISNNNASGSAAVTVTGSKSAANPPNDVAANRIRFTVNATQGNYKIYARALAATGASNSHWVRVNNGDWVRFSYVTDSNYKWTEVSEWLGGSNYDPVTFNFTNGNNTIDFAYRETNTILDKIYISENNSIPNNIGDEQDNCDGAPKLTTNNLVNAAFELYPNPASGMVGIKLANPLSENINIEVSDLLGRVRYAKEFKQTTSDYYEISLEGFEEGLYYVSVQRGDDKLFQRKLIVQK